MILRHWDATYTEQRIDQLPRYDGFVFTNEGHGHDAIAKRKMAEGKRGWSYFNVLTAPPPEWPSPMPPYLQFVRDVCPVLRHPQTGEPIKSWAGGRELISWPQMDSGKLLAMATVIRQVTRSLDAELPPPPPALGAPADAGGQPTVAVGCFGAFLDLAFEWYYDWMMPAADYRAFTADFWNAGHRRFNRFMKILAGMGVRTMANGGRENAGDMYFEHAQRTWTRDLALWVGNPGASGYDEPEHVLSVEAADEEYVDKVIQVHRQYPAKWIAFSTLSTPLAEDIAYQLAAAA